MSDEFKKACVWKSSLAGARQVNHEFVACGATKSSFASRVLGGAARAATAADSLPLDELVAQRRLACAAARARAAVICR